MLTKIKVQKYSFETFCLIIVKKDIKNNLALLSFNFRVVF